MKTNFITAASCSLNHHKAVWTSITIALQTILELKSQVILKFHLFDLAQGPTLNKTGDAGQQGTMTVISRNNGWLTVDPTTMSRKNAFDKKAKGDLH